MRIKSLADFLNLLKGNFIFEISEITKIIFLNIKEKKINF